MNIPDIQVILQLVNKMDSDIDDEESYCYNEKNKLTKRNVGLIREKRNL